MNTLQCIAGDTPQCIDLDTTRRRTSKTLFRKTNTPLARRTRFVLFLGGIFMPENTFANQQKRKGTPFGWKCLRLFEKMLHHDPSKKRRYAPVNWAVAFDNMPRVLQVRKDRIIKLLQWLVDNPPTQFTPVVTSPTQFRDKFQQIEAAVRRQAETDISGSLDNKNIKQWAQDVIEETGNLNWPGNEKDQELTFVQLSLASYAKFLNDLDSHLARLRRIVQAQSHHQKRLTDRIHADKASESILERFTPRQVEAQYAELEFFVANLPFEPVIVISAWLIRVHKFARIVEDWDGRLLDRVWQRRHRWVREDCTRILRQWDCDDTAFDRLITEMEKLYG